MRFDYDLDADALYVTLTGEPVAATREVEPLTMVDVDAEDRPVGIEVIDPNRGWPLDLVLARYPLPEQAAVELLTAYQHAPAEVRDRPSIRKIAAELVERHPRTPGVRHLAALASSPA